MDSIDTGTAGTQSLSEFLLIRAQREAAMVGSLATGSTVTASTVAARCWLAEGFHAVDQEGALGALLGARARDDYAGAIGAVRQPLLDAIDAAAALPSTQHADGLVAPAGTGLHRLCGAPARAVATWRHLPHGFEPGVERDALLAYPSALAAAGYACADELYAGLPGALLLGLLRDLPGVFDEPHPRDMEASAVRAVLSQILDLGDTLALSVPENVVRIAVAQVACDRSHRARRLLATHLELVPDDVEAALAYARLRIERDRGARAGRATRDALVRASALSPDNVPVALALARVHRERGDLQAARSTLERLQARRADAPGLAQAFAVTDSLNALHDSAERPETMPTVTPDDEERRKGRFRPDTLEAAAILYRRHGTLAVSDAFDPSLLEACHSQFVGVHRERFDEGDVSGTLGIGDRRFQVSLPLDGAFNAPAFYANGFVLPLVRRLLDEQAIVGSMVCATSLPGARAQHLHKDHRALFTQDANDEPLRVPPVAVTVMIPLVALDETVGTTEVRKGSHLRSTPASERMPAQRPVLSLGGFFLMDLALSHAGQGNRSECVRPIVNLQYTRRWFVDNKNFHKQRPLEIESAEWARVPRKHRGLFDWACQPGARVGR